MFGPRSLLVLPAKPNIGKIVSGLSRKILVTKGQYKDLAFKFKRGLVALTCKGVDIKDFSFIWLSSYWSTRDLAFGADLYLKRFLTPHTFVEKACSKVTDQMLFTLNNIKTPDTFFINNPDISNHVDSIEDICGYPLIIKDITGSAGRLSFYIQNRTELLEKTKLLPLRKKYLFQKFIPNNYDWGILVANGQIVSGEKSYPASGEFRNNCNGAKEVFVRKELIPQPVKEMAIRAAAALDLQWSRADIVIDKVTGEPYLMEVNRCPSISPGTPEVAAARDYLESQLNGVLGIPALLEIMKIQKQEQVKKTVPVNF